MMGIVSLAQELKPCVFMSEQEVQNNTKVDPHRPDVWRMLI